MAKTFSLRPFMVKKMYLNDKWPILLIKRINGQYFLVERINGNKFFIVTMNGIKWKILFYLKQLIVKKDDSKKFVVRFRFYWTPPEGFYLH